MNMIVLEIKKGQEVMETAKQELDRLQITSGAIVSILGAVDSCCISNMPKSDAMKDTLNEYREPLELSGAGDVRDGKPHIHCVASRENEVTLAGHLHWARVDSWFVRLYVIPMEIPSQ